ncbi:hypothetical protein ACJQWK_08721 [Exserohilum turcicum]|uniref:SGNH hydrolase-type esterase domain-containing protein n=1 Tax=Exserohilum turcicum (strain 28A) TaxID=671987 RepID=R0K0Y4_EXST2|nr:uncharacterized protein SETTUDRAFT_162954 [Exserohilum turcica Et28A]EOA86793.1 hypothetical protein SETTUDRAFT_162954 [Exserohilum turcica Et28A]
MKVTTSRPVPTTTILHSIAAAAYAHSAMTSAPASTSKISCSKFYFEWKGHGIDDLVKFRDITLSERPGKPIIYLAGDSSLDNKYWVNRSIGDNQEQVPEIYRKALKDPVDPKPDVAYWTNHFLADRATCINTAVEESMLRERDNTLLPHDEFIRDNIRANDILIVSVGANDVALKPNTLTIRHMLELAWLTPRRSLENGTANSLSYFKHMFGAQIQDYISRLTAKTKPRAVIACMIYFPLESGLGQTSWADTQLKALGYNSFPGQLQAAIRAMYEIATKKIRIEGTHVVPCALFEVLNGKDAGDYTARVEPNAAGGKKMAEQFVKFVDGILGDGNAS